MGNWILVLVSYFLGNFSMSYIVGKTLGNIDIRKHGSGNAGSTNVLRVLGLKAGAITFIGDSLKGVLAVYIGGRYGDTNVALMCGAAAIIGHNWPIVLKFKGGKGIATSIGAGLMLQPIPTIIAVVLGIIILIVFKYVSLASIMAISIFPLLMFFKGENYLIFGTFIAMMAIYRHRSNIVRIFNGTESKITDRSKSKG